MQQKSVFKKLLLVYHKDWQLCCGCLRIEYLCKTIENQNRPSLIRKFAEVEKFFKTTKMFNNFYQKGLKALHNYRKLKKNI